MDPVSTFILLGLVLSVLFKTGANAFADVKAAAQGKTPPSHKRWETREAARQARGEKPKKDPGYFGRWWANAVEEQTVKAAQKHKAKMEILEEDERENVDAHKAAHREKQAKKKARAEATAAAWDRAGETFAGWFSAETWESCKDAVGNAYEAVKNAAKKAADEARERREEKAAWDANDDFDDDAAREEDADDPTVIDGEVVSVVVHDDSTDTDTTDSDDLAPVIPIRPGLPTGTTDGSSTMTKPTVVTEITSLETAKTRVGDTRKYLTTAEGQLADALVILEGLFAGVAAEASSTENDKGAVKGLGFEEGTKVITSYSKAVEEMSSFATKLGVVVAAAKEAAELGITARSASQTLLTSFAAQDTVAEVVGAAAATTGVAKNTSFYNGAAAR